MEANQESQFEPFEKRIIRRELLPIWIKIFCWLFMLMGGISLFCLVYGAFGNEADLAFYGLKTSNPISATGLIIIAVMAFKGFTAYSLWFEKDNAIVLGKIDAVIGIVLCVISMFVMPFIEEDGGVVIRLEMFLLLPYIMKLNSMEYEWDNLEEQ